jgi:hypothetical protein
LDLLLYIKIYPLKSFFILLIIIHGARHLDDLSYNFCIFYFSLNNLSCHLNPQQAVLYNNEYLAEHLEVAKNIELARRASLGITSLSVTLGDVGIRFSNIRGSHRNMCLALKSVIEEANNLCASRFSATLINDRLIMGLRGSIAV